MNFELQHALLSLDARTPEFFVIEALRDPDPRPKRAAREALRSLDKRRTTKQLIEKLKLI